MILTVKLTREERAKLSKKLTKLYTIGLIDFAYYRLQWEKHGLDQVDGKPTPTFKATDRADYFKNDFARLRAGVGDIELLSTLTDEERGRRESYRLLVENGRRYSFKARCRGCGRAE